MKRVRFVSTVGRAPSVGLREALLNGLAPDGGLYMPERPPALREDTVESLIGEPLEVVARTLARSLFGSLDGDDVEDAVAAALDFPIPLVRLADHLWVLELFHGPTLAFKDVGARVMARLLTRVREDRPITVLTATSGDTGGAVAHAFHGVPGIAVIVLYPRGRVSPRQERQFATLGGNVQAVEVAGSFDDCQRLAKEALATPALREAGLTSANSINVGRLLPQAIYYAYAYAQLDRVDLFSVVSVPSGNLGNLTGGLVAKRMGIPIARFVAACNTNDRFVRFLATGTAPVRPSVATLSTAMDVGDPSNVARIRMLYHDDVGRLRRDVSGYAVNDDDTRQAIRQAHERYGYVMDPHTAVGYSALTRAMADAPGVAGIVLATAHPAKFADVVEPIVGTAIPVPERFAAMLDGDVRRVSIEPSLTALTALLTDAGAP